MCGRDDRVCCYIGWFVGTECNSDRTEVNSVIGRLLCERDYGVCCYTGWYVGTECNSDRTVVNSVTGQLLCERDDGVFVIPAGMWELYVIVTELSLIV